jgi:hypothetical protein
VWAIVMTFVICLRIVPTTNHHLLDVAALVLCAAYGALLGWQHRMGTVFVAPIISWLFAWVPLWVVEIVERGFVKGFFAGLFWVTIGWLLIGSFEFVAVGVVATFFRLIHGRSKGDVDVVIIDPPTGR